MLKRIANNLGNAKNRFLHDVVLGRDMFLFALALSCSCICKYIIKYIGQLPVLELGQVSVQLQVVLALEELFVLVLNFDIDGLPGSPPWSHVPGRAKNQKLPRARGTGIEVFTYGEGGNRGDPRDQRCRGPGSRGSLGGRCPPHHPPTPQSCC